MKRWLWVVAFCLIWPAAAGAQPPSNEALYRMIQNLERRLDEALEQTRRAVAEADQAREEASRAKDELARVKASATPAAAPAEAPAAAVVRVPEIKPGLGASMELVYLRPSASNLDYVIDDLDADFWPEGKVGRVEPDYTAGGRYGVSYTFASGTDVSARYATLQSAASDWTAAAPGRSLWGTWLHPDSTIDDNRVTLAGMNYDFDQEVIDLGAGKRIQVGSDLDLRVEAGLRYATMSQEIDIAYHEGTIRRADISSDNDFSGWGPRVGLGLDWKVAKGLNLFGALAGSMLVGDFDLAVREIDNGTTVVANLQDSENNRVVPVVEMRTGIGYAYQLGNGLLVGAKAGYEWQNWFNMASAQRFLDDVDPQLMSIDTTDIALDGFFLEGFVNF